MGMTILATASMVVVPRFAPRELRMRQRIPFRLTDPCAISGTSWRLFVLEQERLVTELACESDARLQRYLSFCAERAGEKMGVITVRLAGPSDEPLGEAFAGLIRGYVACCESSTQRRPEGIRREEVLMIPERRAQLPEDAWETVLRDRIARAVQECRIIEQRVGRLQDHTNKLKSRLVGLDDALARDEPADDDPELARFVEAALGDRKETDAELGQCREQVLQLREEMARLDAEAGQADTRGLLEELNRRREAVAASIAERQKQVNHREEMLAAEVRGEYWPAYRAELEATVAEVRREADSRAAARDMAGAALEQQKERVADLTAQLARMTSATPAALQLPLPGGARTVEFSVTQVLCVIAAGLIGGCLGWLAVPHDTDGAGIGAIEATGTGGEGAGTLAGAGPVIIAEADSEAVGPGEAMEPPGRGWSPQYDVLADGVERMRRSVACPVILVSSMSDAARTPRPAVNLAIALTRRELAVLLIEVEPGRADLQEVFDLTDGPGLQEFLRGEAALAQVVHKVQLPRLGVMLSGGGGGPGSGVEGLGAGEAEDSGSSAQWDGLRKQFDTVILHCDSALGPGGQTSSEGPLGDLLECADGLVCLAGHKRGGAIGHYKRKLSKILPGHETELLGFVMI